MSNIKWPRDSDSERVKDWQKENRDRITEKREKISK